MPGAGGFFASLLVFGGWGWWLYEHVYPMQWKVNRDAIGSAASTGLQK